MTDKEKRIAAAELIGWEWKGEPGFMCWHSPGGAFMGAPLFADHTRQKEDFVHVLPSCQHTPYDQALHMRDAHILRLDSPEFKDAAKAELDFLISLLPEGVEAQIPT